MADYRSVMIGHWVTKQFEVAVNVLVYHNQLCVYTGTRRPQEIAAVHNLVKNNKPTDSFVLI